MEMEKKTVRPSMTIAKKPYIFKHKKLRDLCLETRNIHMLIIIKRNKKSS
uniref:Uncharacterized protein n=1 Tax=Arundo donax TaxID=35708 RepID=A0A0A9HLP7_ARUDO